ncbi:flagellar biosynthetic protein FliR [Conexibacter sp. SYSU D00693]|uniref:flagellar biosynthetic protein FliR n=1 Tax=Conexibacter sp. SYSU D00693 TaxID=2812560 RepID=UPI00196B6B48|nr:flagellar biosynthetic protein FliR [Conexibacter sp. SYSU D00693]
MNLNLSPTLGGILDPAQVASFFLVLARVSPLFMLAPLFSSRAIPMRVRGIVAVALAVGLGPVVMRGADIPLEAWALSGLIAKELLVGAGFAFAVGAVFAAVQVAGAFLDTFVGFTFGGLVDPMSGQQSSVLSSTYAMVGLMIFIAIGGDRWVIQGMAESYDVVGLTELPSIDRTVATAVEAFSGIFAGALQVAGPVLLAVVLTDAAFGLVSRVVPQLNVFAIGFPAKVTVGLLTVGASLPFLSQWLQDRLLGA